MSKIFTKYKFLFFILCILLTNNIVIAQWEYQESGVTVKLKDVCFVDSLYGWSIGDSSTIISTKNGGKTWGIQNNPDMYRKMNKIQFINRSNGLIIGQDGLISKSDDSGFTWQNIDSNFTYYFSDLSFIDANTGWVTGWKETPQTRTGVILHTKNGGDHWDIQLEINSNFLFGSTIFESVDFLNDSVGWVFGGDYADNFSATYTYFTSDGGKSWQIIGQWESSPQFNLTSISSDTLWSGGMFFLVSVDAGQNWIASHIENPAIYPCDISPVNGLKGWAIHNNYFTTENKIMYTENGGQTWQEELDLSDTPVNSITNISGRFIWAVGDSGLIIKGKKAVTAIHQSKNTITKDFILYQNFPNPFNPETIITYNLPFKCEVELSIYNIAGQKITSLVSATQSKGIHKVKWNATKYANGFYFYTLKTNKSVQYRKMLLIK